MLRVCSALVLVPLAIGTAYVGGWPFAAFWGLAALGVLLEWCSLVAPTDRRFALMTGAAAIVLAVALAVTGHHRATLVVLAMGTLGAAALASSERRIWVASGVPYAGAIAVAPIVLRADSANGFFATLF